MIRSIFSLITIFASVLFAVFYVQPKYQEAESRRAEITTNYTAIGEAKKIQETTSKISAALEQFNLSDKARLDVFFPDTLDTIRFANNLKYIGLKNNLALSDLKVEERASAQGSPAAAAQTIATPDSTEAAHKYVATKASFSVVATYIGFMTLLDDIENSLGILNVTSLTFQEYKDSSQTSGKSSLGNLGYYKYSVELETYSLK